MTNNYFFFFFFFKMVICLLVIYMLYKRETSREVSLKRLSVFNVLQRHTHVPIIWHPHTHTHTHTHILKETVSSSHYCPDRLKRCCSYSWESSSCTLLAWSSCLCQQLSAWVKLLLCFSPLFCSDAILRIKDEYTQTHMLQNQYWSLLKCKTIRNKYKFIDCLPPTLYSGVFEYDIYFVWRLLCSTHITDQVVCFWQQVWTSGETSTSDLWQNCSTISVGSHCDPGSAGGKTHLTIFL